MKKKIIMRIILVFLLVFLMIVIPFLINELYKFNKGYVTVYSPSDILYYYSSIIGCIITVSGLLYTIVCNKNETKKQLNIFKTQNNIPFFIITSISSSSSEIYQEIEMEKPFDICLFIEKNDYTGKEVFINLKNIGDGSALSPKYYINLIENYEERVRKQVQKGDYLNIKFNLLSILNNKFGFKRNLWETCAFQCKIILSYNNIYGIDFYQNIDIEICWNNNQSNVVFKIIDISCVEIES